jgi:hypothetical protein
VGGLERLRERAREFKLLKKAWEEERVCKKGRIREGTFRQGQGIRIRGYLTTYKAARYYIYILYINCCHFTDITISTLTRDTQKSVFRF